MYRFDTMVSPVTGSTFCFFSASLVSDFVFRFFVLWGLSAVSEDGGSGMAAGRFRFDDFGSMDFGALESFPNHDGPSVGANGMTFSWPNAASSFSSSLASDVFLPRKASAFCFRFEILVDMSPLQISRAEMKFRVASF
jgi:hypothetical protein